MAPRGTRSETAGGSRAAAGRSAAGGGTGPIPAVVPHAFAPKPTLRVVERRNPGGRPSREILLALYDGGPEITITHPLTCAIAHAIWEHRGGGSATNWADAEAALASLIAALPVDAEEPETSGLIETKPAARAEAR